MHESQTVANYFLELAKKQNKDLTLMQLLKLVYIAHGWTLALLGRHLIKDEVQAWQYGPVISELYEAIRQFGKKPVKGPLKTFGEDSLDEQEKSIVEQVYDIYGNMSGLALSRLTHKNGSPWHKTYEPGSFGLAISNDLIQDYYAKLAASQVVAE